MMNLAKFFKRKVSQSEMRGRMGVVIGQDRKRLSPNSFISNYIEDNYETDYVTKTPTTKKLKKSSSKKKL